jgi:hypothetical protein
LGPVDPQIIKSEGGRAKFFSAHGIVNAYDKLFTEAVGTTGNLEPYVQQLQYYDDREINQFRSFIRLADDIAQKVLEAGMMSGKSRDQIRNDIEMFLNPEAGTLAHGRPIYSHEARACGLNVEELDVDSADWRSIYELYARTDRYASTGAAKVVESTSEAFFVPPPTREG